MRTMGRIWGGAVLLLVTLAPAPAAAQGPTDEDCLACHGDPTATTDAGKRIGIDPAKLTASPHGQLGMACVQCHADLAGVTDFPHAERLKPVDCATCHDTQVAAYGTSIHAAARRTNGGGMAATCVSCHGSHDILPSSDPGSRTYALNLPKTCGTCHGNPDIIKRGHISIGNVAALYQDSIHGQAVSRSGLLVAANCSSCHGSHDIRRKTDPESKVSHANVPATCGTCHEGIEHEYGSGVHGTQIAGGNMKAPVCSDCHSAHQIQRAETPAWTLSVINECGTCHAEKMKTYRDTFHGQVTRLGFVRVATCADCHGAHAIYPESDPRSKVSRARRVETCRKCHTNANDKFAQYDPHADKDDRTRNAALYYASRGMRWLLIGVFSFFGIHTLLWLPRAGLERRIGRYNGRPQGYEDERSEGDWR
jgi:predicted CxxxxCH...CXXCH cytochrome family protein